MPYDTGSIQKSLPGLLVLLGLAGLLTATVALEPPTGTLEGQVQAEAGKRPLPGALVWAVLDKPIGRDDILFRKRALTDAEGRFRFPGIPAGGYHLSVHARGYWPGSKYDIIVGSDRVKATMPIPMQARSPELSVWASGSAERKDYPFITLTGYLESDTIAVSVYPFDLRGPLHSGADPRQQDLKAPTGEPALRQEVRITRTDSDGAFTRRVTLPVARPGSYLVAARSGKVSASALLLVSDLALVVKQSSRKLLVYAAHLSSGTPIRGADIEIRAQNRRIASGRTGDNGLYDMDLPRLANRKASEESSPYLVIGKHGDSLSYVFSNYWSYGGPDKCYLYTDRPIYRPSQEVHFKGILRREAGGYYTASAGRDVEVSVRDASDTQVYAKTLRTNPFGTFHDTLTLGEEPGLGSYRIIARSDGSEYYGYFEVAEYRKPEYQVAVVPAKASATVGETVRAQVRAAYYFGPPVAHARVAYTVYKSYDYYYPSQAADPWEEYYEESDTYGYGEVVQQGNAVTDGAGMALLSVPTEGEAGSSFENVKYTIEAELPGHLVHGDLQRHHAGRLAGRAHRIAFRQV